MVLCPQALVLAAVEWLVRVVLAVLDLVAHLGVVDALLVLFAHPLAVGASRRGAPNFVTRVTAVILPVAPGKTNIYLSNKSNLFCQTAISNNKVASAYKMFLQSLFKALFFCC